MTTLINESFDNSRPCLAVFIDLAKAFDTLNDDLLLQKFKAHGVRGMPLLLFKF